jgi:hypothetical protein
MEAQLEKPASAKGIAIVVAHGLAGWALCGATMGVGMAVTTLRHALIIHAVAAPVVFAVVSFVYFRHFSLWSPLRTASAFLSVVIAMDLFVVGLLIERSFKMFASLLGTWLPFVLIFVSSWWTGSLVRRRTVDPSHLRMATNDVISARK